MGRLTWEKSLEILVLREQGWKLKEIAVQFGISEGHASCVCCGLVWDRPEGSTRNNFRGGRRIDKDGYVLLLIPPDHPFVCMANTTGSSWYIGEHRLAMAEHLGRALSRKEVVHHEDGDRQNNSIENLRLFSSQQAHRKHHAEMQRSTV